MAQKKKNVNLSNVTVSKVNGRPVIINDSIVPVPLGESIKRVPQVLDLACCRNIFIASSMESDKLALLEHIADTLTRTQKPGNVKFLFASFGNPGLKDYSDNPNKLVPPIASEETVLKALDYLYDENMRRKQAFAEEKEHWIIGYNDKVGEDRRFPFIFFIIDEVAGLMKSVRADFCRKVSQIALTSRFTGVMMIFATSEVSDEVARPALLNCFPKKAVFRLGDAFQSNLVLGFEGAEKLGQDELLLFEPYPEKNARIIKASFLNGGGHAN